MRMDSNNHIMGLFIPFNLSYAQMLIALDPGHGGQEAGAQNGELREADIALDIAKRMKRLLIQNDFTVMMALRRQYNCRFTRENTNGQ